MSIKQHLLFLLSKLSLLPKISFSRIELSNSDREQTPLKYATVESCYTFYQAS